jgi:hypothetical protein
VISLLAVLARDLAFTAARRMLTNCAIETKTFFREKSLSFVHRGIKTLQFMFGRNILHFERHKQRQFTQ